MHFCANIVITLFNWKHKVETCSLSLAGKNTFTGQLFLFFRTLKAGNWRDLIWSSGQIEKSRSALLVLTTSEGTWKMFISSHKSTGTWNQCTEDIQSVGLVALLCQMRWVHVMQMENDPPTVPCLKLVSDAHTASSDYVMSDWIDVGHVPALIVSFVGCVRACVWMSACVSALQREACQIYSCPPLEEP